MHVECQERGQMLETRCVAVCARSRTKTEVGTEAHSNSVLALSPVAGTVAASSLTWPSVFFALARAGGSVKCLVDGCERRGKSRGFCWAHGGGTKCSVSACAKVAVSNGCCWAHGGGKRCAYEGCNKAAFERTFNYCAKHHDQLKDGNETLEV